MSIEEALVLNDGQQAAFDSIMAGNNVFLTGEAGTGKSVVVREAVRWLKKAGKNVLLCAYTGIAAQNIGGSTIHLTFGFSTGAMTAERICKEAIPEPIKIADALIIDEIGTVRRDYMNAIAWLVCKENAERAKKNRTALQIIVVGDFTQLPPIADDAAYKNEYGSERSNAYAFKAGGWKEVGFECRKLTEAERQSEPTLVDNLRKAQRGDTSCLSYFNQFAERKGAPDDAVFICGKNASVDDKNQERLNELEGELHAFDAIVEGEFREKDCPSPFHLELKIGARVMCTVNDEDHGFFNGSLGVVSDIDRYDDRISVDLDSGKTIGVARHCFHIKKPITVKDKYGKTTIRMEDVGKCYQYPLKLAWAFTYHKCQAQTFDKILLDPETWDSGQLYTGLSRITSPDGLWLTRPIQDLWLKADEDVIGFCESTRTGEPAPDTWASLDDFERIKSAKSIIKTKQTEKVEKGSIVTLLNGERILKDYAVVSKCDETKRGTGAVYIDSPLGKGLMGKKRGARFEYKTDSGKIFQVEVLEIKKPI